jgi:Fe-S oxidoreductase
MARAVARLLLEWGVDFGILAEDERCDGNEVKVLGETGLFEQLAKENIKRFEAAGVRKIITLSPHGFHAIKNEYPKLGGSFEVCHYPQLLAGLVEKGEFRPVEQPLRVTFHDPCYLGRHNKDYLTPRAVLGALPGIELLEMDRAMGDALCCGGGGGNSFTDVLGGGADSASRVRVREAAESGAEVLAVACPKCARMFEDAIKDEHLEDGLRVRDIAEIVQERCA